MLISNAQTLFSLRLAATEPKGVAENSAALPAASISAVCRGLVTCDEAAFREFHALYFDRLYRFLIVVARGDENQAQEALQLTLIRVVRYARMFDSEDAFWSWLKVVARSAARDVGRKQQRYSALLRKFASWWEESAGSETPGEVGMEENRLRFALEESLAELTDEDRKLLESKYVDGDTAKAIAERCSLSQKALESRLLRLRRDLRERILRKLRGP